MPITSNPDAFYISNEEFFERFGFEKPRASSREGGGSATDSTSKSRSPFSQVMKRREADSGLNSDSEAKVDGEKVNREAGYGEKGKGLGDEDEDEGVEEVVFYCKAGVRSRAAARMAREWVGVRVGDMKGGWMEWEGKGGQVER